MISRRRLLASAAAGAVIAQAAAKQPNFIVFLADDLGSGDLGCQGATDVKTPHIDSIATAGARFTNWYANAPVCAPSRAALMTGKVPQRCGVATNGKPLAPSEATIASLLKTRGYATGLFGKWHLGSTDDTAPTAHGFDSFFGFHSGCIDFYSHRYYWGADVVNYHDLWRNRTEVFEDGQYMTELITREAKAFLAARAGQPFFMYVAYNAVHYPMHAPAKYVERFRNLPPERRMYCAMLAAMDDSIGEILSHVDRANTFVVFLGDNGATTEPRAGLNQEPASAGRNGIFKGFKFSLFDGGMHVPCVMSWPGVIPAGQKIDEVCMTMDLLPTICKAAGAALPPNYKIDGMDMLPVAARKAKSPHRAIFWESAQQQAVRKGDWKLVLKGRIFGRTPEEKKPLQGDDAIWLSNLAQDPGETTNLRHKHPELVDELSSLLHQWKASLE